MVSYEGNLEAAKEKALAQGKEPFDFIKFISIYVHDRGSCERLRPDEPKSVQDQYEREYYVYYPDMMTIEEYAEFRNRLDESY